MREEFALRINEFGHRVRVHTTAEGDDMKLVQLVDVLEELLGVGTNSRVVPGEGNDSKEGSESVCVSVCVCVCLCVSVCLCVCVCLSV